MFASAQQFKYTLQYIFSNQAGSTRSPTLCTYIYIYIYIRRQDNKKQKEIKYTHNDHTYSFSSYCLYRLLIHSYTQTHIYLPRDTVLFRSANSRSVSPALIHATLCICCGCTIQRNAHFFLFFFHRGLERHSLLLIFLSHSRSYIRSLVRFFLFYLIIIIIIIVVVVVVVVVILHSYSLPLSLSLSPSWFAWRGQHNTIQ